MERHKVNYSKSGNSVIEVERDSETTPTLFDNLVWLSTKDAAVYLRKFKEDGSPSDEAIRKLVYRGALRPRTFRRRLYFKRVELDYVLEGSHLRKRGS